MQNTYRDIRRIACASGNIWGFVEGSDAIRTNGGSWRGQMPAAHLGVRGGVRCQRRTRGFVEGSDASGALGG